jgi:UDP-N-acetyl-D-mannosaminuronic acid transferase (WecB/TagA/CpsF family)
MPRHARPGLSALPVSAALLASLLSAACGSSGGGTADAGVDHVAEANDFLCPTGAAVTKALGAAVPEPNRSTFKTTSVLCTYVGTAAQDVQLVVTFGATAADLDGVLKVLPEGATAIKVSGLGDGAYWLPTAKEAPATLYARSGDRLISVSGKSAATQAKAATVARLVI